MEQAELQARFSSQPSQNRSSNYLYIDEKDNANDVNVRLSARDCIAECLRMSRRHIAVTKERAFLSRRQAGDEDYAARGWRPRVVGASACN